ncbi:hypothetical protein [Methylobacterium ajmalii]|jgi:hypothetical protein|uniref:hypothetical protein n=1 Tax=Methylobacterium ajmalii TaxID=2738439 RepID=UPI00190B7D35|nr:hypothetical protein [Methylobacterium ajmalii]MBK3400053.1 hypothetical protein [Methylobacterium ajmalii]MBK3411348.1 hypothetical protein [Methylobacterium ajmalii]MBK3426712.1 hypothetical protein [Methylobacterium ajmalii]
MPFALKLPRRNPDAPRPSLRERAAALKVSAAKVMGKPARFTPPKPIGAGEPSKALAVLIDAHQLAYGRYLIARSDWTPDLSALRQAEEEAFRALLHSPLRSDADRVAYAVAVIERQSGALGDHVVTGRDHPLSVAYRSLRFGEHAREAAQEPSLQPVGAAVTMRFHVDEPRSGLMTYADDYGNLHTKPFAEGLAFVAARLNAIARSEYERRFNAECGNLDAAACEDLDAQLRCELRLDALHVLAFRFEQAFDEGFAKREGSLARFSAAQIDLSRLDVFQLSSLFEAYQAARFSWEGVTARPYSFEKEPGEAKSLTEFGEVAEFEQDRASWIMHRLEREIASRKPEDEEQRDEILMVRTQQEFRCNMRIHDNALLLDISRAWIV